jgi:hypothetical protein
MHKNLYSVLIIFSDFVFGIGQYESVSPEAALEEFLRTSESLEGYDRDKLLASVNPLFPPSNLKGLWTISFNQTDIGGPDNNPVLGGHIVQTDMGTPTR